MANGLEDKSKSADGKLRIGGGSAGGDEEDRKQPRPPVKKEEQQMIPDEDGNTRFCHYCGKGFKSGKALGGHMRVHELNKFNKPHIKPTSKFKYDNKHLKVSIPPKKVLELHPDGSSDKSEIPQCDQCFKIFPSKKSLYGHMRCHSDRPWRGIQPPTPTPTPLAALDDDDDSPNNGLDLASSLTRWGVTGTRGRMGKPVWWTPSHENDPVFNEACTNLYLLAMGKTRADNYCEVESIFNPQVHESKANTFEEFVDECIGYSPSNNQATHDDDEDDEVMMSSSESVQTEEYYTSSSEAKESASKNIKHLEDVNISRSSNGKLIAIPNDDYHQKNKMKLTEEYTIPPPFSPPRNPNFPGSSSKYKNMYSNHTAGTGSSSKFRFDRDLVVPKPQEFTLEVTPGHKCSICGRTFNTHHGLGGHMSIHSRDKTIIDQSVSFSPANREENRPQKRLKLSEGYSDSSKQQADGTSGLFKCKDCNRTFTTGQALGGHKKFHRPAGPSTEESQREASSYSGGDRREVNLGIDLNMTPPEEEEEAGAAATSGDDSAAN